MGISLWQASNVVVTNNSISETGNGILSLDQQTAGIMVEGGGSNIITANHIANNYNGIICFETINNLITKNYIAKKLKLCNRRRNRHIYLGSLQQHNLP